MLGHGVALSSNDMLLKYDRAPLATVIIPTYRVAEGQKAAALRGENPRSAPSSFKFYGRYFGVLGSGWVSEG